MHSKENTKFNYSMNGFEFLLLLLYVFVCMKHSHNDVIRIHIHGEKACRSQSNRKKNKKEKGKKSYEIIIIIIIINIANARYYMLRRKRRKQFFTFAWCYLTSGTHSTNTYLREWERESEKKYTAYANISLSIKSSELRLCIHKWINVWEHECYGSHICNYTIMHNDYSNIWCD